MYLKYSFITFAKVLTACFYHNLYTLLWYSIEEKRYVRWESFHIKIKHVIISLCLK